jgi:hypothetical protein
MSFDTIGTLDAAVKAIDKAKTKLVKKKKEREKKDAKIPPGGRGQPRPRGLGRGRGGGRGGGGWEVVRHFTPCAHWGWNGGGNQGYHSH